MQPLTAPKRHPNPRPEPPLTRRDPAPSRVAYKLHRLWLRPFVRKALRVGLPAFVLAMGVGLYLSDADRRASLGSVVTELREKVKNRPEFLVTLLSVEGASSALSEVVRRELALPLPQSSLDRDLEGARARVAALDAVADVTLRIKSGGVLEATVREREPAVAWRTEKGLTLLDATGHRVEDIAARADRADLPLIAGEGAEKAVPEALQIVLSAGPLLPRLRGLQRMADQRWDVILDRSQRILLPADAPVRALERLIAIDRAENLLERDILSVDLRLDARPAIRLAPKALIEARRARGIIPVENEL